MTVRYLYHYTRAETLPLVLKSQKIRFNRLDLVRDLTEGRSIDLGNLGMYQFVSCWTDHAEESIPVWGLYTPGMSGVRIKLSGCMFRTFNQESDKYRGIHIDPDTRHILRLDDRIEENFIVAPLPPDFPHRIVYTDDPDLLAPRVVNRLDIIEFGKLGIHKSLDWQFESEWRFRVFIMPHPVPSNRNFSDSQFSENVGKKTVEIFNSRRVAKEGLFAEISEEAFRNMEVTLGPCLTRDNRARLELLVKRLNPDCRIIPSRFTGQIRCDQ